MTTPANSRQIPDHAILDYFGKQIYLGNQFHFVLSDIAITSTAEQMVALVTNPAVFGAPNNVSKGVFIAYRRISSLAQAGQARFYINPTVTSIGTPLDPVQSRPASSTVPVSKWSIAPSVSANGTLFSTLEVPSSYFISEETTRTIILDPGQSMLITFIADTGATTINLNIGFYEI